MPTCYAITDGECSSYGVCAVFTTRELAESEQPNYGPYAEIEEFPLDPVLPQPPAGMSGFRCYWHDSTATLRPLLSERCSTVYSYERSVIAMAAERVGEVEHLSDGRGLSVYLWARDEQHAIKIASEKFTQYRAIQAGAA